MRSIGRQGLKVLVLSALPSCLLCLVMNKVVLQADQLDAPAPGTRGIALSKKPAAELKLSKQKLVRGMIEFSLETPRAAAAAEASPQETATPGAGAGDGVTSLDAKRRGRSHKPTPGTGQATREGDFSSGGGGVLGASRNMQSQQTSGKPVTAEKVAGTSFWRRNKDDGVGTPVEQPRFEQQPDKPVVPPTLATAATASKEKADDVRGTEAEWEGVTWDEGDVPKAESLGSVSASLTGAGSASLGTAGSITLGTVELASRHGNSAEPQDVLICLKGVTGLREVVTNIDKP